MKPSDLTKHLYNSIMCKSEAETIARNIMIILERTGNTFRSLNWYEYKHQRLKDGNFTEGEKKYFNKVIPWCSTEEKASLFSPVWKNQKS